MIKSTTSFALFVSLGEPEATSPSRVVVVDTLVSTVHTLALIVMSSLLLLEKSKRPTHYLWRWLLLLRLVLGRIGHHPRWVHVVNWLIVIVVLRLEVVLED